MAVKYRYRLSGFLKGFGFLYFLLNGLILIVMGIFAVHAKIKTNMSPGYIVAILPLLGVFSGYWMRIGKYGWWRILIIIISFSFSGAILLTAIFISPKLEQVKKEKFEAGKSIQQSNIDLSDVLIKAGADIHHRSKKGNTPLMFYSYSGYTEGIKYLISLGASINARNMDGQTAYDIAQTFGHVNLLEYLKSVGALPGKDIQ